MSPSRKQLPHRECDPSPLTEAEPGVHPLTACDTVAQETVHSHVPDEGHQPAPPPATPTFESRGSRREWLLWALLLCATGYAAWQHIEQKQHRVDKALQAPPHTTAATIAPAPIDAGEMDPVAAPEPAAPTAAAKVHEPDVTDTILHQTAMSTTSVVEPVPLLPAHVPVRILSNAEDAAIHSNGRLLGYAGATILLKPLEQAQLTLSTPRHRPRTITLEAGDGTVAHADYFVALEPLPTFVQVEARAPFNFKSPRRAEVFLNQVSLGDVQLPYVIELPEAAAVHIGLRAAGFLPPEDRVLDPEPGATEQVMFDLEHMETLLRLDLSPPHAKAWVGGQEVDPAHILLTPGLLHAIRITADGYRPMMRDIVLESGETRELKVEMRPYTYFLIVTDPPHASLFMDGKRLTERRVRVRADHVYSIDARASGYHPYRTQHKATEGATEEIHIRMRRKWLPF